MKENRGRGEEKRSVRSAEAFEQLEKPGISQPPSLPRSVRKGEAQFLLEFVFSLSCLMSSDISSSPDVQRGFVFLHEAGGFCACLKSPWRKCYLVLKDGSLFFYDSPESLKPRLQFPLYGAACVFAQYPKTSKANSLEVHTPQQSILFASENAEQYKIWAGKIQRAAVVASGGKLQGA